MIDYDDHYDHYDDFPWFQVFFLLVHPWKMPEFSDWNGWTANRDLTPGRPFEPARLHLFGGEHSLSKPYPFHHVRICWYKIWAAWVPFTLVSAHMVLNLTDQCFF